MIVAVAALGPVPAVVAGAVVLRLVLAARAVLRTVVVLAWAAVRVGALVRALGHALAVPVVAVVVVAGIAVPAAPAAQDALVRAK